ncbi:MAG: hypothetical protein NZ551_11055 [Microscillaceae bacterium]|nr:hypothetical protein [Microscillaceae bacterium]MDW8461735.1 hypothetical protein [Cytophagales bacterium]
MKKALLALSFVAFLGVATIDTVSALDKDKGKGKKKEAKDKKKDKEGCGEKKSCCKSKAA